MPRSQFTCRGNSVVGSVVAGAFQITFRVKMHANDVFLFFKNHFWYQHIKTIQNIQTILNFSKKKNSKFLETQTQPQPRFQKYHKKFPRNIVGWLTNSKHHAPIQCPCESLKITHTRVCECERCVWKVHIRT